MLIAAGREAVMSEEPITEVFTCTNEVEKDEESD